MALDRKIDVIGLGEAVWDLFLGMLAAIGMIFKGIWSWFLGLIGWD